MPTAIPSIAPMSGAKSGTSVTTAVSPTRLELTNRPPIATARGSPAATSDPKVIRRTTAAAISPSNSVPPGSGASANWTARPVSATSRP